jgi:hypothetical protein
LVLAAAAGMEAPVDAAFADVDGDGSLDVVSANAAGDSLAVFFGGHMP